MKEVELYVKNYLEIFREERGRELGHGTEAENTSDLLTFANDFLLYDED